MTPVRVGIVGLGNISGIYLQNLTAYAATEIVAVADLDRSRAAQAADKHGVPHVLSPDELLSHPDVDLVLNLTIPKAHAAVALAAVKNGKHVYSEKPLSIQREDARQVIETAKAKGVRVGCAPDTFLGAGIQTCRRLIDEGAIGDPVAANAFMLCRGHETWHPSPAFYYEQGGGPMLDMGPYYVTALINLLGGIRRVTGSARATFPTRTITSKPLNGTVIPVETPTHLVGVLDFDSGVIGQITTSFDVYGNPMPPIVIYGTEGTLYVPDPNGFGGEVFISRRGGDKENITQGHGRRDGDIEGVPLKFGFAGNSRGVGVLDMAHAIVENRPHRASGDLAFHALDVMLSVEDASNQGRHIELSSGVDRPAAMSETEFAS
ncbi:Gfo/Idh/MocA family protein [Fimbriimonas ginsengisoli]|uniref:Dehydrogenase n=1 Tax=Fimbriimonas ginsengisoli Gsoil 348 TaxID=661478 RepID=A0A068NPH2_FIMGI|nr:Gfo/Idh/MocA family oxidoreductase [Fimbriimonas ginsengisoli]AIE83479.1 Dehydrogenase [Fimbriimonas ginsengisoli Gsoil 348]